MNHQDVGRTTVPGEQSADRQSGDERSQDDWQWRRRIRSNPHSHRIYRWVVAVVGLLIVAGGVVLLPLPGPGWVIIFLGLAVWASEFEWARRLLRFARDKVRAWGEWLQPKPLWVKGLVGLATAAVVAVVFWALFAVSGVPGFLPDAARDWLRSLPGL
ncbi:TIGR02611 family protein [Pedococcus sp. 5OH_020]|uniref:TIGR02611 family protein n=1 Tax=Pedococcus sp. 5OH_020 TaxID=2989814 RepID=UPI0022E9C087|nr:TIGR02611 family protein [Pedococcus sp. 5OH_020]